MKKIKWVIIAGMLFAVNAWAEQVMSVQVRETVVRDKPSFLGHPVSNLVYGDRVTVVEKGDSWSKVRAGGQKGWMHTSALTRKKLEKKAGQESMAAAASSDEIALAGKGFSEEIENEYKQQNTAANFDAVDRMEQVIIPEVEMRDFLLEGGVIVKEGV